MVTSYTASRCVYWCTALANAGHLDRDAVLPRSLVSAHTLLFVREGEFVSLLGSARGVKRSAAECRNEGTWPVLAGEPGECDAMLSSPIILYDYPPDRRRESR